MMIRTLKEIASSIYTSQEEFFNTLIVFAQVYDKLFA